MRFTKEQREAGVRRAREAASARRATAFHVGQSLIYRDSPPGVGWVIKTPGRPNRYYATSEAAKAAAAESETD